MEGWLLRPGNPKLAAGLPVGARRTAPLHKRVSPMLDHLRTTTSRAAINWFSSCAAVALSLAFFTGTASAQTQAELEGAWEADRYLMAAGGEHDISGRIFFSERDWQVLFFVLDERSEARRGSAEGGSYQLEDGLLTFTHLFNLSVGEEMLGLPAAELRMVARSAEGAPQEPTQIDVEGDLLTLHFPSGNRMIFRRR